MYFFFSYMSNLDKAFSHKGDAQPQILLIDDFGVGDSAGKRAKQVAQKIGIPDSHKWEEIANVQPYSIINGVARIAETASPERLAPGSSVIGVIDPHVGNETDHRRIAFRTKNGINYVGPDNGIFSAILEQNDIETAVELDVEGIIEHTQRQLGIRPNNTFHGETVFTPTGVLASRGADIEDFGEKIDPKSLTRINIKENTIVDIDKYGNPKVARSTVPEGERGEGVVLTFSGVRKGIREQLEEVAATIQEQIVNNGGQKGTTQLVRQGSSISPLNPQVNNADIFLIEGNASQSFGKEHGGIQIGDKVEIRIE